jgi:O-antigen ligase
MPYMSFLNYKQIPLFLIGLFPLCLLIGSFASELLIFIIIIFFLSEVILYKKIHIFRENWFIFLITIWIYLIFNLYISSNFDLSFNRSILFIRFPILILAINYFIKKNDFEYNIIFKLWAITIFITISDLYFQYIFGYNILGIESPWLTRLSGFMGDELKVAHLLIGFTMPIFAFYFIEKKNKFLLFLLILIYFIILLLINERSNAIKGSFIIIFFIIFFKQKNIKLKFISFIALFAILISVMFFNQMTYQRYIYELKIMYSKDSSFKNIIMKSNYGPHYMTGLALFKKNPLFGTGLKTFRVECKTVTFNSHPNPKYASLYGCTTHPHQLHIELLSEIGIVGYLLFFSFFGYLIYKSTRIYRKNNDLIILSSTLFLISQLIPLLPSGSFFTSFSATIFWINMSIILSRINKNE